VYELIWTRRFTRNAARFERAHPNLAPRLARVLHDLESDPFQPHLRLHRLRGQLADTHAVSVTHEYRIDLILRVTEREITLLDIGSHDEVYR
jgi:addiction module RelE/StbE family toxin